MNSHSNAQVALLTILAEDGFELSLSFANRGQEVFCFDFVPKTID